MGVKQTFNNFEAILLCKLEHIGVPYRYFHGKQEAALFLMEGLPIYV